MKIVVVCSHCCYNDTNPNIEINLKDRAVYYYCPKCKKKSEVVLKPDSKPFPRIRGL